MGVSEDFCRPAEAVEAVVRPLYSLDNLPELRAAQSRDIKVSSTALALRMCLAQAWESDAEEVAEVRLFGAQACALRPCSYLACAAMLGASEAALPWKRCLGCKVARYCSRACQKADYREHKLVCAALAEQRQGGQPAEELL